MLRPMHEMNGDWYPWCGTVNGNTPAEYVAAWRHIHDIFEAQGATNVTWVWSVNHQSYPETARNAYSAYYPGDRYVDWTAVSGFNWGTSGDATSWHTFRYWYDRPLAYLHTLRKPICLAEFGSVEEGGDKAAWFRDTFSYVSKDPHVKALIYYNAKDVSQTSTQDWRIDTSARSLAAFRASITSRYFVGGPPAALLTWTSTLSAADRQRLASVPRIY